MSMSMSMMMRGELYVPPVPSGNVWMGYSPGLTQTGKINSLGYTGTFVTMPIGNSKYSTTFDGTHMWQWSGTTAYRIALDGSYVSYGGGMPADGPVSYGAGYVFASNWNSYGFATINVSTGVKGFIGGFGNPSQSASGGVRYGGGFVWGFGGFVIGVGFVPLVSMAALDNSSTLTWTSPYAINDYCYDGTHMWITHTNDNKITKWNATGLTDTFNITAPLGMAYDGTDMWISSSSGTGVTKMSKAGTVLLNIASALNSSFLAFDGTHIFNPSNVNGNIDIITLSGVKTTIAGPAPSHYENATFDGASLPSIWGGS